MTKVSAQPSMTGAAVDPAADVLPIIDMSLVGDARNKRITVAALGAALAAVLGSGGGVGSGGTASTAAPTYATRAELSDVSPGAGDAAFLLEGRRFGLFVFNTDDLSSKVTVDTQQGIYVAPSSDADGSSGAWVRQFTGPYYLDWFMQVAGRIEFATDDLPAFNGAIAVINATNRGAKLAISSGLYFFNGAASFSASPIWITGAGSAQVSAFATIIRFPNNSDGFILGRQGSILEGMQLWGGNVQVNGAGAITSYAGGDSPTGTGVLVQDDFIECRDVQTTLFGGGGFRANADGAAEANSAVFYRCQAIYNGGHGFELSGSDGNAGAVSMCSAIDNAGVGFYDASFLGNAVRDCHTRGNGMFDPTGCGNPVGGCSYAGNNYILVNGQHVAASTTVPGTNANVWLPYYDLGGPVRPWVTGMTWRIGGSYASLYDNANSYNSMFSNCYAESSQPPAQVNYPAQIHGGLIANGNIGTAPTLFAANRAFGADAWRTTATARGSFTYQGEANGVASAGDVLGGYDGAYSWALRVIKDGEVEFARGGGPIFMTTAILGGRPNWFIPRHLAISSVGSIGNFRRHSHIDTISNLDGLALIAGEVYYFNAPLGYQGVTVVQTGNGGTTAKLAFFGKIGYPINVGASRVATLDDAGCYLRLNAGAAVNLTIPPNSAVAFPVGTEIDGIQAGAGAGGLVAGSGVTLNSSGADLTLAGQFAGFTAKKIGVDEWDVVGKF